jgi:hypothetical protein
VNKKPPEKTPFRILYFLPLGCMPPILPHLFKQPPQMWYFIHPKKPPPEKVVNFLIYTLYYFLFSFFIHKKRRQSHIKKAKIVNFKDK